MNTALLHKGDTICADLKALGHKPVWMQPTEDRIAIGFELISEHPTWTKAFDCEGVAADAKAFVLLMAPWKAQVRKDIAIGMASPVVRQMIQQHGIVAVMKALS